LEVALAGTRILTSTLKCLALLESIAEAGEPLGVSELARRQGTGRGTVHQQLSTLVEAGWVEQADDSRYRLSLRATRIGYRALEQVSLGSRIQPALEALASETAEAVSLAVIDQTEALIVQRVESGQVLRAGLGVGTRMPLARSASGRVLLAFSTPAELKALRERGVEMPPDEILERARAERVAVSIDEFVHDVFAVAAPVFDVHGRLLAALSTAGPTSRYDPETAIPPLRRAAEVVNGILAGKLSTNGKTLLGRAPAGDSPLHVLTR